MSKELESEVIEKDDKFIIKKTQKEFMPILSQFEITALISVRTTQIENGAEPCIEYSINDTPKNIAIRELEEKKIPFMIKRKLNNYIEIWKIDELELNTDLIPYD